MAVLSSAIYKKAIMNQFYLYADIFKNQSEYKTYEPIQSSDILIFQAQDDRGFEPAELETLKNVYPQAEKHALEREFLKS